MSSWWRNALGLSPARLAEAADAEAAPPAQAPAAPPAVAARQTEAKQDPAAEPGWTRLTGEGTGRHNDQDLAPLAQDRMQRLAEWLWQSNLLANRLVEIMLAYLLAEGVSLQCPDEQHQKLLTAFWNDPINNWPLKLVGRARGLSLMGEQCYICRVNEGSGFVRLGYLDPRHIGTVVMDPDNPEQPIGVVTKRDAQGKYHKYRVVVLGNDDELFSRRTAQIRRTDFTDGDCLLYQVNKLPSGSRGRSDLLGQMDWLDAYDEFLFAEIDRIRYLRSFVWDVAIAGANQEDVDKFDKTFRPPAPNSKFVHSDSITLSAISPELQAADTSESARLLRNHVLGGGTVPEHWFGGGGDVNRAAAGEMGEPTFKMFTARQQVLKLMLEEIGRYVLMQQRHGTPDWSDPRWQVTAVFPELVNRDIAKFSAAMQSVAATVVQMRDAGLLTDKTALQLVADVAARFGQEIDAEAELEAARKEHADRQARRDAADAFSTATDLPGDSGQGGGAAAAAAAAAAASAAAAQ